MEATKAETVIGFVGVETAPNQYGSERSTRTKTTAPYSRVAETEFQNGHITNMAECMGKKISVAPLL